MRAKVRYLKWWAAWSRLADSQIVIDWVGLSTSSTAHRNCKVHEHYCLLTLWTRPSWSLPPTSSYPIPQRPLSGIDHHVGFMTSTFLTPLLGTHTETAERIFLWQVPSHAYVICAWDAKLSGIYTRVKLKVAEAHEFGMAQATEVSRWAHSRLSTIFLRLGILVDHFEWNPISV